MCMSAILYYFKLYNIAPIFIAVFVFAAVVFAIASVKRRKLYTATLASVALALAGLCSFMYFGVQYGAMKAYAGSMQKFDAVVEEVNYSSAYSSSYDIRLISVGEDGAAAYGKAILNCNEDADLEAGNRIVFSAEVSDIASENSLSYGYDLLSDGFFLSLDASIYDDGSEKNILVTEEKHLTFYSVMSSLNGLASDVLTGFVGGDEGGMASALLLGNRDLIPQRTRLDFNRSGVSHVLALSGMHMTVVMGAFEFILKKCRIRKPIRCILLCITSFLYLALTGFSLSACRAVIMLMAVYISYIVSAENDSLTSLGMAGALIILLSPPSVTDCGFWLSFFATFGLVVFASPITSLFSALGKRHKSPVLRFIFRIASGLAVSVVAFFSVIVFSWIYFGQVSLTSVPMTALISPMATLTLVFSVCLLALSWLQPAAFLLSFAIRLLCRAMIWLTGTVSSWSGVVLSLEYGFTVFIMIPFAVLSVIMLTVKLRRRIFVAAPAAASVAAFAICLAVYNSVFVSGVDISYINHADNEFLLFCAEGQGAVLCDVTDGSYSAYRTALREIESQHMTEIDSLIITHLHKRHAASLDKLLSNNIVRHIYIYSKTAADNTEYYKNALEIAQKYGVDVQTVDLYSITDIAGGKLKVMRSYNGYDWHLTVAVNYERNGISLTYLSNGLCENSEFYIDISYMTGCSEYVIFGGHGSIATSIPVFICDAYTKEIVFGNETVAKYADVFKKSDCRSEIYTDIIHFNIE